MSFNTDTLDRILKEQALQNENKRQDVLKSVKHWLDDHAATYGVERAYIFGSLTRPHQFKSHSDIDIAVEQVDAEGIFMMISFLMTDMNRDVDVIELRKCHFADKIRETGILWTTPKNAS
ncbi:nucleotidyltransferase domain-containing protein [Geitlerinema sp. P-1104]|uniref:nucleotidyltransferase family protein n=1 Tax=Geitlerinema sp. P-1104 TaxID=2546230 RepID=UPI001981337A|nr:nucleotidyltransferase domain-containing protein [Geitlerinema sp. P-1104]